MKLPQADVITHTLPKEKAVPVTMTFVTGNGLLNASKLKTNSSELFLNGVDDMCLPFKLFVQLEAFVRLGLQLLLSLSMYCLQITQAYSSMQQPILTRTS